MDTGFIQLTFELHSVLNDSLCVSLYNGERLWFRKLDSRLSVPAIWLLSLWQTNRIDMRLFSSIIMRHPTECILFVQVLRSGIAFESFGFAARTATRLDWTEKDDCATRLLALERTGNDKQPTKELRGTAPKLLTGVGTI